MTDLLTETYDNGETLRFIGSSVGSWIETDTVVNTGDWQ